MRIVGGQSKGKRLKVARKGIRPTKAIVREAIFNIIGSRVQAAAVLDIFAGSGALGLEAMCHGASTCVFIEKKTKSLLHNIKNLSVIGKTNVIASDFRTGLRKVSGKKFDIIFLDPPYNKNFVGITIELICRLNLLQEKGLIIAEHYPAEKFGLPDGLSILKEKHYGETAVTVIASRP